MKADLPAGQLPQFAFDKTAPFVGVGNGLANTIVGAQGGDRLSGRAGDDILVGGGGRDRLSGEAGDDQLAGGALDDRLAGGAGDDVLAGGAGADRLTGGSGADVFVFDTPLTAVDTVVDFRPGADALHLKAGIFRGLARGALPEDVFHLGTAAADASDRILYDKASGVLAYDRDGSGDTYAATVFAMLRNKAALSAADIVIV